MNISPKELESALLKYFGFKEFRNSQAEIINTILNAQHSLVVMPTGGGKSLCYQLPAILSEGTAIVISPLIALMKDQVDALTKSNIPSAFINSSLPFDEINIRLQNAINSKYKLLYIAPERLESTIFQNILEKINISFLAVDEAHCISEWGHDFRPAYLSIIKAFQNLKNNPIIALTATATPEVQNDILKILKIPNAKKFITGFDRPNLSYIVELTDKKIERLISICKKTKEGSTIIYCGTRKKVEEVTTKLKAESLNFVGYHAGMPDELRKHTQEQFINNKCKFIVATNAFGMGIDKPDVRNVIHCDITSSLESYYQEAGRAGRDGLPSNCILLYNPTDRKLQEFFIKNNYPPISTIEKIYNYLYSLHPTAIGQIQYEPILLDDVQIANKNFLPLPAVSSILNLFERHEIIRRSYPHGNASLILTAPKERITQYFHNTTDKRKKVLEAILKYVNADAFYKLVEFDYRNFLKKYKLSNDEVTKSILAFEFAQLLKFYFPENGKGIWLLLEKMHFDKLPIDFDAFEKRKKNAYKKLDLVEEYAMTSTCKRNFILNYFQDTSVSRTCGRCSSCVGDSKNSGVLRRFKK
ncbi:MAG: ATP-dependent DNA helicase RecQ [FCB group bacterium]|jgi:ATP-dependent DNA helicase RecQ